MYDSQSRVEDFLADEYFVEWVLHPNQESNHFWEQWLLSHPDKKKELERAKEFVSSVQYESENELSDIEYASIFEQLAKANASHTNRFVWLPKYTYRVAATIILLIASVFLFMNTPNQTDEVKSNLLAATTEYGQKRTIKLSDGTMVTLNAGSRLEYPDVFVENSRKVKLTGEAFFDVSRNPEQPFLIESQKLTTRVLGTSFNVRSYPEESSVSVSVITGKVQIQSEEGEEEILLPEDMGVYHKSSTSIAKMKFDEDQQIGWTKNMLIFENESLPAIFRRLEKWYGVDIQVKEGMILQGSYSGRYIDKSLELVLEGISYASQLNYKINQKKVIIYEKDLK